MIHAWLRRQLQIGAKERRAKLGHQLFAGVAFIAPALAAKVTVKAGFVLRPVSQFMGKRGVVCLGAAKRLEGWHLHMIAAAAVMCAVPAMANVRASMPKEFFRVADLQGRINHGLGLGVVVLGQAFDLLDVKDAVALHERDFALFLAPIVLLFGLGDGVGIDHQIAAFALPDVRAKLLGLPERHPVR